MASTRQKLKALLATRYADIVNRRRLPRFRLDSDCERVFMVGALSDGAQAWMGQGQPPHSTQLGTPHAWRRYVVDHITR